MAANGAAVVLPFAPEPLSPPAPTAAGKPDAGIEDLIGEVLVAFADASLQAVYEYSGGRISPATREKGGELVATLYAQRQALGEHKFAEAMRQQGRLRLRRHGVNLSEADVDEVVNMIAGIVDRVAATNAGDGALRLPCRWSFIGLLLYTFEPS
jgi:hypothetical protein